MKGINSLSYLKWIWWYYIVSIFSKTHEKENISKNKGWTDIGQILRAINWFNCAESYEIRDRVFIMLISVSIYVYLIDYFSVVTKKYLL